MLMLSAPIIGVVLRFLAVVRPAAPVLMPLRLASQVLLPVAEQGTSESRAPCP